MAAVVDVEPRSDVTFKLLMLGDSGVGKSSLMLRYAQNRFVPQVIGTTGVDLIRKIVRVNNLLVNLQIWDTAGQERFRGITKSFYKGAHGIILTYDVTDRTSFKNIHTWIQDIQSNGAMKIILVGNKTDLPPQIQTAEGQELARQYNLNFVETSARNATNVETAFLELIKELLQSPPEIERKSSTVKLQSATEGKKKKRCC